jgi:DNA-binding transcriptional LysR family regulator
MPTNLPTDLLRSLVAIVDSGSMLKATETVFLTQSALSLQMKRLEDLVQRQLFSRKGKRLLLTSAGQNLVTHARQILDINDRIITSLAGEPLTGPVRIGLVQDFAEALLAGVLRRFSSLHPRSQLQVRVAGSAELLEELRNAKLDIAMCVAPESEGKALSRVPMIWIGQPDLLKQGVIPIATLETPCIFRSAMLRSLENAGLRYRIVAETPSLTGLRAAVRAGLGITCRTQLFVDDESTPLIPKKHLPSLPGVAYALFARENPSAAAARLSDLVREAVLRMDYDGARDSSHYRGIRALGRSSAEMPVA